MTCTCTQVFMVRMEEAARFDTEQNRKGKPAFKKLAMLDEVRTASRLSSASNAMRH